MQDGHPTIQCRELSAITGMPVQPRFLVRPQLLFRASSCASSGSSKIRAAMHPSSGRLPEAGCLQRRRFQAPPRAWPKSLYSPFRQGGWGIWKPPRGKSPLTPFDKEGGGGARGGPGRATSKMLRIEVQ
jgi:hypothetical protein